MVRITPGVGSGASDDEDSGSSSDSGSDVSSSGGSFGDIVEDRADGDDSDVTVGGSDYETPSEAPDTPTDTDGAPSSGGDSGGSSGGGSFGDIVEDRADGDDDRDVTVGGVDYETPSTAPDTPTDTGGAPSANGGTSNGGQMDGGQMDGGQMGDTGGRGSDDTVPTDRTEAAGYYEERSPLSNVDPGDLRQTESGYMLSESARRELQQTDQEGWEDWQAGELTERTGVEATREDVTYDPETGSFSISDEYQREQAASQFDEQFGTDVTVEDITFDEEEGGFVPTEEFIADIQRESAVAQLEQQLDADLTEEDITFDEEEGGFVPTEDFIADLQRESAATQFEEQLGSDVTTEDITFDESEGGFVLTDEFRQGYAQAGRQTANVGGVEFYINDDGSLGERVRSPSDVSMEELQDLEQGDIIEGPRESSGRETAQDFDPDDPPQTGVQEVLEDVGVSSPRDIPSAVVSVGSGAVEQQRERLEVPEVVPDDSALDVALEEGRDLAGSASSPEDLVSSAGAVGSAIAEQEREQIDPPEVVPEDTALDVAVEEGRDLAGEASRPSDAVTAAEEVGSAVADRQRERLPSGVSEAIDDVISGDRGGTTGQAAGLAAVATATPEPVSTTAGVATLAGLGLAAGVSRALDEESSDEVEVTEDLFPDEVEVTEEFQGSEVDVAEDVGRETRLAIPEEVADGVIVSELGVPEDDSIVDPTTVSTAQMFRQRGVEDVLEEEEQRQEAGGTAIITGEDLVDPDELHRQDMEELGQQVEEQAAYTESDGEFLEPEEPLWTPDGIDSVAEETVDDTLEELDESEDMFTDTRTRTGQDPLYGPVDQSDTGTSEDIGEDTAEDIETDVVEQLELEAVADTTLNLEEPLETVPGLLTPEVTEDLLDTGYGTPGTGSPLTPDLILPEFDSDDRGDESFFAAFEDETLDTGIAGVEDLIADDIAEIDDEIDAEIDEILN